MTVHVLVPVASRYPHLLLETHIVLHCDCILFPSLEERLIEYRAADCRQPELANGGRLGRATPLPTVYRYAERPAGSILDIPGTVCGTRGAHGYFLYFLSSSLLPSLEERLTEYRSADRRQPELANGGLRRQHDWSAPQPHTPNPKFATLKPTPYTLNPDHFSA